MPHKEYQEARRVERLAAVQVSELAEHGQKHRERQRISHRDPADGTQMLVEITFENRQHELRDAGVELPHESADTDLPTINQR